MFGATGALTGGLGTDTGGLLAGGLAAVGWDVSGPEFTGPAGFCVGRSAVADGRDGTPGPGLRAAPPGFGGVVTPPPGGSRLGRDATLPPGCGSDPGLAVSGGFALPVGGIPVPFAR